MGRKVNLAVVGTGRMGSVHVRNVAQLIPEANLVALCDLRLEVAQALADELGIRRVVKDHHDLLTDKDIEAVLVTASTDAHAAIMKDWARAGKHIFCEKPLAMDLTSIDEVLKVVKQSGVKLQVGFNRRFDKSFRRVREIVASGRLGRPSLLRITNRDPEVPAMEFMRLSGGMFLDMTIHDFDMARFQVGEVEEVYAAGCVLIEPALAELGDIDTGAVILKFAGGALGLIDNSRKAVYGYDQRLEVFCAEGVAIAGNESETTLSMGDVDGFHGSRLPHFFMQRFAPCYVDEVRQFLEAVRDDTPVPITGDDGRAAVVLGHAAFQSMRENRPVRVSEIRAQAT
jgi:myo-inositol 2-dehydrogenase/D-chiro-inositol 1-dehydrogenase